jgi:PAS domain S-box-containing protein
MPRVKTKGKVRFRDLPISQKLTIVITVTTTGGLLLAASGITIVDSLLFRGYLERDLSTLSRIMADNSAAAISFNDPSSAGETLAALRARPHIVAACTYGNEGLPVATYSRGGTAPQCPPPAEHLDIRRTPGGLVVSQPIIQRGAHLGTLVLVDDLGEVAERARVYGTTVVGVILLSSLAALLLSSKLRGLIAKPISQLAYAATSISATKDYSIRARKDSDDELGVLVDSFNEMLSGIQSRDRDLSDALGTREEALREAQRARDFLRTTLASIGDAVISTDVAGRILFANPVARSLLRLSEDEAVGALLDDVFRIINEFTREPVKSPAREALRDGDIAGIPNQTVLVAADGSEIPIDDTTAPIRAASGEIQGTVLVFRDVTARRAAEGTRRLLASIVESSDDAIIGMDLHGTFTSWNKGAERIFGYSAAEMIGRGSSIIAPSDGDEIPALLENIGRGERVIQYQTVRSTKSGRVLHVAITVSPIYDSLGRVTGASKIARDITEQVLASQRLAELNVELQRTNESLARSNEDLERFAFVASHDLQEPLRMIAIYAQLLSRAYPPDQDRNVAAYLSNILGGARRMRDLLTDLLAYSEIGSGPDDPITPVDLNVVMEKVTENLRAAIEENEAVVESDFLPTLSAYQGHLISLFQNILSNAIKYRGADNPRIHVSVRHTAGQFRFAIADNGIGIDPKYQERIFVAFKRLHGKKIAGNGIGLAICQRIVERYGGRIWVESELGEGSTFVFTLPDSLFARGDFS